MHFSLACNFFFLLRPIIANLKVKLPNSRKSSMDIQHLESVSLENIDTRTNDRQLIEVVHTLVIFLCVSLYDFNLKLQQKKIDICFKLKNPLLDLTENNSLFSIILYEIAHLSSYIQNSLIFALRR